MSKYLDILNTAMAVLGTLFTAATLYYTIAAYYGWKPEELGIKGAYIKIISFWPLAFFGVLGIALLVTSIMANKPPSAVITSPKVQASQDLKLIVGQTFKDTTVVLDGNRFDDCAFENVSFQWNGGPFYIFRGTISGHRRIETFNSKVVDTIDMLKALGFLEKNFSEDWKHIPKTAQPSNATD